MNGKEEQAGTAATNVVNDQTVTTITVNRQQLEEKLAAAGLGAVVTIPVSDASDVVISELNGEMVKSMENKQAVLEIKTPYGDYTLPAAQINIASISRQFGSAVTLSDIKVSIRIGAPSASSVKEAEQAAAQQALTLVAPAVEFTVEAVHEGNAVKVTDFHTYVERTIAVPDQADPSKITTGVVIDPDYGIRHVPTKVTKVDNKYYAQIKSLSNSMYSVIWNPLAFKDVEGHWAKDAVNDMGSRLVIDGVGNGMFKPDETITRAEFAAVLVRGLGLKPAQGTAPFADVAASDWYQGVVKAAYDYRLIDGFEDGGFHPEEKITREQAVVILARALTATQLEVKASSQNGGELLKLFADGNQVSGWAKDSVQAGLQTGLMSGRSADQLAPQANITRAEVAALIQRMLQEAGLI
ncbi:Endo-1,4-beta-xylanase A precursor [compost metagenome]